MEHLCKCNRCDSLMYDENPQVDAPRIDTTSINREIYPMEMLNVDGETFWGCGHCQTDAYLSDVKSIDEI